MKATIHVMTDDAKAAKREADDCDAEIARLKIVIAGLRDRKQKALKRMEQGSMVEVL
jgi:hypothetical protein